MLAVRALCVVAIFAVLHYAGMGPGTSRHLEAQQAPQEPIVATTLFDTLLDSSGPGSATVSVASFVLAPGQATLPLTGTGSLLILVESGRVTLVTDTAFEGLPVVNDNGAPGLMYHLRAGQRVTIPSIGTILFRNEGEEPSNLMLLTLVPEGGSSLLDALVNA